MAQGRFQPLFNGKDLKGWTQCNGKALYKVEKGEIVGTTVEGSPNSFLCTDKEYGDFVLEYETKTEPVLNSGVQIRGHRYAADTMVMTNNGKTIVERKHPAGRVYGYQVETANEESRRFRRDLRQRAAGMAASHVVQGAEGRAVEQVPRGGARG